jgi:large subunit ribosomal protein L10
VKEFAKQNENLTIKGGLMDGEAISAAEVEAIASLPSREVLMAQIAGAINGVARGLAMSINGVPSGIAQAISQVAEQKEAA